MLILGHVGVGLGIVQLAEVASGMMLGHRAHIVSRLTDYRFLAVGTILPDLIDKPLAWFILPGILNTTRSFGHTLAFSVALLLMTIWSRRLKRSRIGLSLTLGTLSHLLFDGMWSTPQTLLWPVFGWGFPGRIHHGLNNYWSVLWDNLWQFPWLGPSEVLGALVIAELLYRLWRAHRLKHFLLHGNPILDTVTPENTPVVAKSPEACPNSIVAFLR